CSAPTTSRSAASRSSPTSTLSERLRSRVGGSPPPPAPPPSPPPLPPFPTSTSTGQGPGCAAHSAATARAASGGGGAARDHTSATPIAPLARRSSSGWGVSTMAGAAVRGGRGPRPHHPHADRPFAPQVVERLGRLDDERRLLFVPVPRTVAPREQQRAVGTDHLVELGPRLREHQRFRRAVEVLQ